MHEEKPLPAKDKNGEFQDMVKMMKENPQATAQILEEEFRQEMLGTYDIQFIKSYVASQRGKKIPVNGVEIYYETVGSGPHPVLLCPGTSGTVASDFLPQMLPGGFDRDAFTVVAWEARGYGSSCPPKRTAYPIDFFEHDAHDAVALMEKLGHKRFSCLGWCAGGNVALVAASLYPDRVRAVVAWGAYPVISKKAYEAANMIQSSFGKWSEKMIEPKLIQYDGDYLKSLFSMLGEYKAQIYEKHNGDCIMKHVKQVKCPVLLLWLKQDFMNDETAIKAITDNVPTAKLVEIAEAKHAFHLKNPGKIRNIIEPFLNLPA